MSPRSVSAAVLIVLVLIVGCEGAQPAPTPVSETTPPSATRVPPTPVPPTPTVTPLPPLTGSGGGRIAFVSDRDGNNEIYVMNADGTDQRRLTHHSADDRSPVWSPAPPGGGTSGTRIAFESNRHGRWGIYVMAVPDGTDADGAEQGSGDVRRLTPRSWEGRDPVWSPDGTQIAFSRFGSNGANIYLLDVEEALQSADDTDPQPLTRTGKDVDVYDPTWSSAPPGGGTSGTQMAFAVHSHPAGRDDTWTIYVLDVQDALQGGAPGPPGRRLLQADGGAEDVPAWSPDGSQIAFSATRDGHWAICVVNADGTNLRQLTRTDGASFDDYAPAWSPAPPGGGTNGSRIAFQSNPDGRWGIYVIDVDGTNLQRLTTSEANDFEPDWSP